MAWRIIDGYELVVGLEVHMVRRRIRSAVPYVWGIQEHCRY